MTTDFIIKVLIIIIISVICSLQDVMKQKVSNWKIILGYGLLLIYYLISCPKSIFYYLLNSLFIFLIFLIVKLIIKNRLGWADVFFSAFLGLSLDYKYSILAILLSVFIAIVYFLIYYFAKKERIERIPFIPSMSLGLLTGCIFMEITNL